MINFVSLLYLESRQTIPIIHERMLTSCSIVVPWELNKQLNMYVLLEPLLCICMSICDSSSINKLNFDQFELSNTRD
jgi:hypothetical protein